MIVQRWSGNPGALNHIINGSGLVALGKKQVRSRLDNFISRTAVFSRLHGARINLTNQLVNKK
jgi:hypothetical protein